MATPVFGVPLAQVVAADSKKHPNLPAVPHFVWQAVRCINRHGIDQEGIFRISGNKERVAQLKEDLDKGKEIDFIKEKCNPFDVAALLKLFLREFPEPLLGSNLYTTWIETSAMDHGQEQIQTIKSLIEQLPKENQTLLALLMPFFQRIGTNASVNKMDPGNVSKTVGPNLLWKFGGGGDQLEYLVHSSKINDLVSVMIEHCSQIFPEIIQEFSEWAIFKEKYFGHLKSIQFIAAGKEGEVWSGDSNGSIRIWCSEKGKIKEIDSKQGRLLGMTRIGDQHIWTCSQTSIKVWNIQNHECVKEISGFGCCVARVRDTVWLGSDNKIIIYNISDFTVIREIPVPGNLVMAISADSTGNFVWTSTTDRQSFIFVYSTETFELVKEVKEGHSRKVNYFSVADSHIWSAGDDGVLCVWDCSTLELTKKIEGSHDGAVYGLCNCGDYMWSSSWDTTIKIWNSRDYSLACTLQDYHSDCVSSLQLIWHDQESVWKVWSGSYDKSVSSFILGPKHSMKTPAEMLADRLENSTLQKSTSEDRKRQTIAQRKMELEEKKWVLDRKKKELEERRKELEKRKAVRGGPSIEIGNSRVRASSIDNRTSPSSTTAVGEQQESQEEQQLNHEHHQQVEEEQQHVEAQEPEEESVLVQDEAQPVSVEETNDEIPTSVTEEVEVQEN